MASNHLQVSLTCSATKGPLLVLLMLLCCGTDVEWLFFFCYIKAKKLPSAELHHPPLLSEGTILTGTGTI